MLKKGEELTSKNGKFTIRILQDGDLVLYFRRLVLWKTVTVGIGNRLVLQNDGNLVFYDLNQRKIFESNTANRGQQFVVQDDSNLVVLDSNQTIIWSTGTVLSSENFNYPIPFFSIIILKNSLFFI